MSTYSREMLMI